MEVQIAEERIIVLEDRFTMEIAEERVWARRADAFGTVAKIGGCSAAPPTTTSASTGSVASSRSGMCAPSP